MQIGEVCVWVCVGKRLEFFLKNSFFKKHIYNSSIYSCKWLHIPHLVLLQALAMV